MRARRALGVGAALGVLLGGAVVAGRPGPDVPCPTGAQESRVVLRSHGPRCGVAAPGSAGGGASGRATDSSTTARSLALPRVPWEGGSEFWSRFPKAKAGGWSDPSFFPIGVWWSGINTKADVRWDKAHGINTYVQLNPATDFDLIADNGQYWIGGHLNPTFDRSSPAWVGNFLDDEVDGRMTPKEGFAHLSSLSAEYSGDGRFEYTNYTAMVIQNGWELPDGTLVGRRYVNEFADVVSLDAYWLTSGFCQRAPYWSDYLVDIPQKTCNSALSYGAATRALRLRDAADGDRRPVWMFVEDLNGADIGDSITPTELKAAAMSAITNEARGIMWFDSSLSGGCRGNPVIRLAQLRGKEFCGWRQVKALGEVNNFIHSLAPVLNSQSYKWHFGRGLTTMLKVHDGYAYVFSTLDSDAAPGRRTFSLPPGVGGRTATVLGEHRTVAVSAGNFTDSFRSYNAWHVYKIAL